MDDEKNLLDFTLELLKWSFIISLVSHCINSARKGKARK